MKNDAYSIGYEAAEDEYTGKSGPIDCPYPPGPENYSEWFSGQNDFYRFLEWED
ncbi:hypothetical protein KDW54_06620 [Burkholderia ambifaria]|uniref:hypothetical protein n=1 Tax=Burkholderia ambifaria TaxID=152480 RepID=UPI001B96E171|nr:hypothetical protein [Burkholderia ambifaria]MBR8182071.1 hypothetical protein [Burkholderia ambifaria]